MNTDDFTTVPLAAARPGDRLTAAVLSADGQVLMTAGSILTEAALGKLGERGIVTIAVAGQRDEAELNAAREALRQRLRFLFRKCDTDDKRGAAHMLFMAVLDHRLEAVQ